MKTDYMVIGRTRNADNILKLVQGIEEKGYSCYNFLSKPCTPESDGLPWDQQMEILESDNDFWNSADFHKHFKEDMDGLRNSQTIIMLLPAGMAAHMEAGVSYGLGKKMILIGVVEKPETLYLMFNERYPDIQSFLQTLTAVE